MKISEIGDWSSEAIKTKFWVIYYTNIFKWNIFYTDIYIYNVYKYIHIEKTLNIC